MEAHGDARKAARRPGAIGFALVLVCFLGPRSAAAGEEGPLIDLRRPPPVRPVEKPGGDAVPDHDLAPPSEPLTWETIHEALDPVGTWVDVKGAGKCWRPDAAIVGKAFKPYRNGRWIATRYGWSWSSAFAWGWIPSHYGRWRVADPHGWVWQPGTVWAPAYVRWRMLEDGCAWSPLDAGEPEGARGVVAVSRSKFLAPNIAAAGTLSVPEEGLESEPIELRDPGSSLEGPSFAEITIATGQAVLIRAPASEAAAAAPEGLIGFSRGADGFFGRGAGTIAPAEPFGGAGQPVAPQAPITQQAPIGAAGTFSTAPGSAAIRPSAAPAPGVVTPMRPFTPASPAPITPQAPIGGSQGSVAPQAPIGGSRPIAPQAPIGTGGR